MVRRHSGNRGARRLPAVLAFVGVLALPAAAAAQETTLYLDRLRIGGAPDDGIGVWRPQLGESTRLYGQLGLGYTNVEVRVGNGYYGWPQHAPYDKIMVTAACELIPPPLIAQLKPGGRMIAPTGIPEKQTLTLVEKTAAGNLSMRDLLPVRFSELDEPGDLAGAAHPALGYRPARRPRHHDHR